MRCDIMQCNGLIQRYILYLHTIFCKQLYGRLVFILFFFFILFSSCSSLRFARSFLSFFFFLNWMCLTFHDTFGWCWTETHDYIADYFAFAREIFAIYYNCWVCWCSFACLLACSVCAFHIIIFRMYYI